MRQMYPHIPLSGLIAVVNYHEFPPVLDIRRYSPSEWDADDRNGVRDEFVRIESREGKWIIVILRYQMAGHRYLSVMSEKLEEEHAHLFTN